MASATSFRQILGTSPSTASVKNSTLIIIDAQNEYADGKLKCSNTASSRKVIASLLARYREANSKVVHVLHDTPDGAPVLTPGTKLAEEFEELAPKEGEKVVHKSSPSSFAETGLHEHLGGSGQIVLTGYMAHVCVSSTARQASQFGYDVICVEDAIGDRSIPGVDAEQLVKTALSEIADAFGTVLQSSDIK